MKDTPTVKKLSLLASVALAAGLLAAPTLALADTTTPLPEATISSSALADTPAPAATPAPLVTRGTRNVNPVRGQVVAPVLPQSPVGVEDDPESHPAQPTTQAEQVQAPAPVVVQARPREVAKPKPPLTCGG